jgi:hypothetical protein
VSPKRYFRSEILPTILRSPGRSRANVMNIIVPVALLALLTLLVVCDSADGLG